MVISSSYQTAFPRGGEGRGGVGDGEGSGGTPLGRRKMNLIRPRASSPRTCTASKVDKLDKAVTYICMYYVTANRTVTRFVLRQMHPTL